ncbi:hypothetical protein [Caudoviricetes sp.]|nr:hypothetical protein [Caudoviricetes sp.]
MLKALPYASALILAVAVVYSSYQWGYASRSAELSQEQHEAALKAMEKIQSTFEEYERLVSEIENATDNSSVPPLIKSTIDRLPEHSRKK